MKHIGNLNKSAGATHSKKRIGRGEGSGKGGTSTRGHKGQKARSGATVRRGFEGGQMPINRRVPKFGFKNANRVSYKAVNLDTIQQVVDSSGITSIDLGILMRAGVVSQKDLVKVLGRGELKQAVEVKAHAFSQSAINAIEKLGGKAIVDGSLVEVSGERIKLNTLSAAEETVVEKPVKVKKETKIEVAAEVEEPKADVVVEKKSKKTASSDIDDLKKIEGIGPKIASLLNDAGITTFAGLSESSVEKLNEILEEAGSRYASHNPTTWPQQAALAAAGKWDELKTLQESLMGGRPE